MIRRALLALCVVAFGCKGGVQKRLFVRPGRKVSVVAVYPFGFRWEEPPYRSFELSQRLIDAATEEAGDQFLFFGPSEFKVYRHHDDNAWAASTVVTLLPGAGLKPEQAVVLRPWAERRVHAGQKELLDAKGKPVGVSSQLETTYVGHVEVLHPTTRDWVVEVVGETQVDPFEEREDDSDPAPELTELMQRLTVTALEALREYAAGPAGPARELSLSYWFNPKQAFAFAAEGQKPFEVALASLDPLDAELLVHGRVKFANPGISDAEVTKLARLPGGLYVREGTADGALKAGDVITAVDGQPALPQSLQRLRLNQGSAALKVRRASGEIVELSWP